MTAHQTPESQREYQELMTEFGRAVSTWNETELQLCEVLQLAMQAKDHHSVYELYSAVMNFNARLKMTHNVVQRALRAERATSLLAEWIAIHRELSDLAKKRNAIAHRRIAVVMGAGDKNGDQYPAGARLLDHIAERLSPPSKTRNIQRELDEGISLTQVRERSEAFHRATYRLFQFHQAWMKLRHKL